MEKNKIGTRLLFAGNIIKQPVFTKNNYRIVGKLENTDKIMNDTFLIGVWPGLNEECLNYIINKFREFFALNK